MKQVQDSGGVPGQAIEAAIATSSTWPIRDADGKAKYRQRVTDVLEAAAPAIRAQERERIREAVGKLPRYRSQTYAEPWKIDYDGVLRILGAHD